MEDDHRDLGRHVVEALERGRRFVGADAVARLGRTAGRAPGAPHADRLVVHRRAGGVVEAQRTRGAGTHRRRALHDGRAVRRQERQLGTAASGGDVARDGVHDDLVGRVRLLADAIDVGVRRGTGDRRQRLDEAAAVHELGHHDVRHQLQRRGVGRAVVRGRRIGTVRTVVGDRPGVRDLRGAGRQDRVDDGREGRAAGGTAARQAAHGERAGAARVVVRRAAPTGGAARGIEGRRRRHHVGERHAGGTLVAVVAVRQRVGDGAARGRAGAAVALHDREVRRGRHVRQVRRGVVRRSRVGPVRSVVRDRHGEAELGDTGGHGIAHAHDEGHEEQPRPRGQAPDRVRARAAGVVVRSAGPGRRVEARLVRGVRRNGRGQHHPRRRLVALVPEADRIRQRVAGYRRREVVRGDDEQVRGRVHRRRVGRRVVRRVRVGTVRAVLGHRGRVRHRVQAGRRGARHRHRVDRRSAGARRDAADRERARAARVVVRRADPSGRAGARVEGGARRHDVREDHARRAAVPRVRVGERVDDRATGCRGHAAVALGDRHVGRRHHRRRVGRRVVRGRRIGPVGPVVADGGGVADLRGADRERVDHRDRVVDGRGGAAARQPAHREVAGRAGVVVRHADPAGRAGAGVEGRVGRHHVRERHAGRSLGADVRHLERVDDGSAGCRADAAVALDQREVGRGRERRGVGRAVVRGRRVGTVRAVVRDRSGVADLRDARRNGVRDRHREGARGRGRAGRQGPDDVRAGRAGVRVRGAGPARRAAARVERRVRRHHVRERDARGILVADVRERERVGHRAAACRGRAAVALHDRQVGRGRERRRVGRGVVRGRRVGTVRAVVGDGRRVADLRDAGRHRARHGDRERGRAGAAAARQPAHGAGAAGPGVVVRRAGPAGAGEGRVRGDRLREHDAGGALVARVRVGDRVRDGPARGRADPAVALRQREVRGRVHRGRVARGVVAGHGIGRRGRDARCVGDLRDAGGHRVHDRQREGRGAGGPAGDGADRRACRCCPGCCSARRSSRPCSHPR